MSSSTQPDLTAALNQLWARFLPQMEERLGLIERACQLSTNNSLADEDCKAAHDAAHKLAGTLGTFGLPEGSELARTLELAYQTDPPPEVKDPATVALAVAELGRLIRSR